MEYFKLIIGALIGAFISGVVIYLIQGFFRDSRKMIEDLEKSLRHELGIERAKIVKLEEKFEKILQSYGEIFNKLLEKFSQWEDRIKKILDEYSRAQVPNSGASVSKDAPQPVNFDQINSLMKKEIRSIAEDVETLENELKQLDRDLYLLDTKQVNIATSVNNFRKTLMRVMADLGSIKNSLDKNSQITDDKIQSLYKIVKTLNVEQKKIIKKVDDLAELSKNRIVLK